ncbi:MAG: hypothetical protein B7X83_05605 [Polynucleobacter sp. 17-46-58]|nr:MAG: hypothetical protein B7X83_05605 [Polynucleobacter sp. 17-46-58]
MPPKIRGMTSNLTPNSSGLPRFTLMLSGEDALDLDASQSAPPKGLPQEHFLLGPHLPLAPVLLLGQSELTLDPTQMIACLQPVHLHATRDHLILMHQDQIDLTEQESARLLQIALPLLEEDFGHKPLYQGRLDWFIPAGPFSSLATHSILGIAKLWRKLQNEVQMLWHIDPVNEERAQRGLPAMNSLWISGIGKLEDLQTPSLFQHITHIYGESPLLPGLAKYLGIPHQDQVEISKLDSAFAWVSKPESLWPELQNALINGRISEIALIDFPDGKMRQRIVTAKDLYKKSWAFWKQSDPISWQELIASQNR